MKASIVAIFGAIIPEPLAMPNIFFLVLRNLVTKSVVNIALEKLLMAVKSLISF